MCPNTSTSTSFWERVKFYFCNLCASYVFCLDFRSNEEMSQGAAMFPGGAGSGIKKSIMANFSFFFFFAPNPFPHTMNLQQTTFEIILTKIWKNP